MAVESLDEADGQPMPVTDLRAQPRASDPVPWSLPHRLSWS
jgi:hypothetical protein